MRRRTFLGLAAGAIAVGVVSGTRTIEEVVGPVSVRNGRWDGSTDRTRIMAADQMMGAKSGFGRQYLSVVGSFTGSYVQWMFEHGRVPAISLHCWTDQPRHSLSWLDFYHGKYDDVLVPNLQDFKALRAKYPGAPPGYFTFHHEPENEEIGKVSGDLPAGEHCGTRDDFKLAAEHFRLLLRSVLSYEDAVFGVTFMQGRYQSGEWETWMPPRCQFMGIDGYSHGKLNKQGVNPETFSALFTPAHNAAVSTGHKLFIQECGVAETPQIPVFKPNFFADMRNMTKSWSELIGIIYSNVDAKEDYRINSSQASLEAYQALATDPYFMGDWA